MEFPAFAVPIPGRRPSVSSGGGSTGGNSNNSNSNASDALLMMPPTRASMGAWDFSIPASTGTGHSTSSSSTPSTSTTITPPAMLSQSKGATLDMDPAELMRGLHNEEDFLGDDEDFDDEDDPLPLVRVHKKKKSGGAGGGSSAGLGGSGSAKRKARGPKGMTDNPICGHCNTKTTPEWRTGPNGLLLCNACGLKWSRKRQKRPGSDGL